MHRYSCRSAKHRAAGQGNLGAIRCHSISGRKRGLQEACSVGRAPLNQYTVIRAALSLGLYSNQFATPRKRPKREGSNPTKADLTKKVIWNRAGWALGAFKYAGAHDNLGAICSLSLARMRSSTNDISGRRELTLTSPKTTPPPLRCTPCSVSFQEVVTRDGFEFKPQSVRS